MVGSFFIGFFVCRLWLHVIHIFHDYFESPPRKGQAYIDDAKQETGRNGDLRLLRQGKLWICMLK